MNRLSLILTELFSLTGGPNARAGRWVRLALVAAAATIAATYIISNTAATQARVAEDTAPSDTIAMAVHIEPPPRVIHRHHAGTIDVGNWDRFKTQFIRADGELIDNHAKLTHSEGQGYAMLLALGANDRPAFDKIWDWTRTHLRRDDDALLAWKWKPDDNGDGGGKIADKNDAADGDILVAWALHRAAKQWQDPVYDAAAAPIARDILAKLVRNVGGFAVLLPGVSGFVHKDKITVNLSYWIFPAFRSLNQLVPSVRWFELARSGLYLLSQAHFGQDKLPSDWMVVEARADGSLSMALVKDKPLYGYDAVRIPLYLMWDGLASPRILAPFLAFWRSTPSKKIPATVNLETGKVAPYPVTPGMRAIVLAVETRSSQPMDQAAEMSVPVLPAIMQDHDYYSAALGLLVRLALSETS